MTLTLAELQHAAAELNELLAGGRIQKIHQPSDHAIVLVVRKPGQTHLAYLSADAQLARVHLATAAPPNPPEPPQFCKLLRKHLLGGVIRSVQTRCDDRIAELNVENQDQNGAAVSRTLLVEIIPGFENIILLNEAGTIIDALQHAESRDGRRIAPRAEWQPPPRAADAEAAGHDRFAESVREQQFETYSAAIEQAYSHQDNTVRTENLRRGMLTALGKNEKRTKRRLAKIEQDFEATARSDEFSHVGELLKANLHALRKGDATAEVIDYATGRPVQIELDPKLSPKENMQRYFKRARKLSDGRSIISERLGQARREADRLAQLHRQIESAGTFDELAALRNFLPTASRQVSPRRREEMRAQPRQFTSADGLTILVGRNPRQNDDLTMHAAGNDLWVHVQHYPGSHVIVKMPKDKPLLKETLLDAAHLAMHFSKLKDSDKAPIDYTLRKYVRKPRGASPGYVTYSQQKTIMLVPDRRRLNRLLGQ